MPTPRALLLRFLPVLCVVIFFGLLFVGVRNQSHSWYFQDETEHVTLGWMLTEFGRHLYVDLSTNHQPIPILVGGALAKLIPAVTFFEFIDRLRIGMWAVAAVTSAVIALRFRWAGVIAVILTYSLGHYFFAWHVLADSLVVPAVIWVLLASAKASQKKLDHLLFGAALFWIVFNLVPLWPFAVATAAHYIWLNRKSSWVWLLPGVVLPTLILWIFVNPFHWWQETVINNVFYFIPYEAETDSWHYFRLLTYPLQHLPYLSSPIARFYLGGFLLLMGAAAFVKPKKWQQSQLLQLVFFIGVLFLLNPRISVINVSFYSGFHLFPYLAGVATMIGIAGQILWQKPLTVQRRYVLLAGGIGLIILLGSNMGWIWEKRDKMSDYYIQYDTFQAYGTALKTISQTGDTLMTGPDGAGYMNMMADLPLAGRQNFHLEWAYRVPYLRQVWLEMIEKQPPTFIYFDLQDDSYSHILKPLIESKYVVLRRRDGTPTLLRMRKDAAERVEPAQWQKFEEQAFQQPQL